MAEQQRYHYQNMQTARAVMALAGLFVVITACLAVPLATAGVRGGLALVMLSALTVGLLIKAVDLAQHAAWIWEWQIRRAFRGVCFHKNLVAKDANGRPVYPRISQLQGDASAWSVRIHPLTGQSPGDFDKATEALGLRYGSIPIRFADNGDGTLTMRAGYERLEARMVTVQPGLMASDGLTWRERLAVIPVATTAGGQAFSMPAIDTHVLIAGITGAGKGSVIWSYLLGVVPAIREGVVKVWGFDPKRMELAIGREFFGDRYARGSVEMVEMLQRAEREMMERADKLAGKVRKFEPSPEMPLNILVIDELAYLSNLLPDRKLAATAEKTLQTILALGRASGFMVIGALQDPRKETLSFRDLFPTRVAMKLPSAMVDLVLGHGMREAGADCEGIPDPKHGGAGCAYVLAEGTTVPVFVRMTWCPDELIMDTADELPLLEMPSSDDAPLPLSALIERL